MGGAEEQRAIISSELYWFGGLRDSDCHNNEPMHHEDKEEAEQPSNRRMRMLFDEQGRWTVEIDPVEGCLRATVEIVEPDDTDC